MQFFLKGTRIIQTVYENGIATEQFHEIISASTTTTPAPNFKLEAIVPHFANANSPTRDVLSF
jgi:hypothetical protein